MNRAALEHIVRSRSRGGRWADRLVPVQNENTAGAIGWCLDVHDLALSKLVAGRDKDLDFVQVLRREKMTVPDVLRERLNTLPLPADRLEVVYKRLLALELAVRGGDRV